MRAMIIVCALAAGAAADGKVSFKVSDAPADPWTGVTGDKPARVLARTGNYTNWEVKDTAVACTAAHDHCLPPAAWIFVDARVKTQVLQLAQVVLFTPEGPTAPLTYAGPNDITEKNPDSYIAYRTVPVTKANLVVGALVATTPFPNPVPASVRDAHGDWLMGKVEKIDWDTGLLYLEGAREPSFITGARVAVLRFVRGGKVEILGGRARDKLAVSARDVIIPAP